MTLMSFLDSIEGPHPHVGTAFPRLVCLLICVTEVALSTARKQLITYS